MGSLFTVFSYKISLIRACAPSRKNTELDVYKSLETAFGKTVDKLINRFENLERFYREKELIEEITNQKKDAFMDSLRETGRRPTKSAE